MTELELYTAWKKKNIHNYEGTRIFAEANDITPMELSRIIDKFRQQEEPAMARKTLDSDQIKTIEDGIKQGKKLKDIAEEVGCSRNTITARKRKMRQAAKPLTTTAPSVNTPAKVDKLNAVITMLQTCKNIICAEAETKSVAASVDIDESTITFSTNEADYVLTIKKKVKAVPQLNAVTIKGKQFDIEETTALFVERSNLFNDDIKQIAKCVNLTTLDISGNPISDISPLCSLTSLTKLHMAHISVSDVSAIGALTRLEKLVVTPSCIGDDNFEWLKQNLPNCQIISVV